MHRVAKWTEHLALTAGLGASLVLAIDYTSNATALCTVGGGCQEVKASSLAYLGGIPLPYFGVAFFALMMAFKVARPAHALRPKLAAAGALAALALLAIQAFVVGAFCKYCVVTDLSAILLFASIGKRSRPSAERSLAALSAVAAVAMALLIANAAKAPTGSPLAQVAQEGRATIVEFIDFQCPACRALHAELKTAIAPYKDKIQIVRKHLPLARHAHAQIAARAYCCAEEEGIAEDMADRLFTSADLRSKACEDIAVNLGAERARFAACMESERPQAVIESDEQEARDLGVRALPTFFVGDKRFEGVPSPAALRSSIRAAVAEI